MSNPRELAQQLAYITVIHDRAKELKDELRQRLVHALDDVGADSAKAEAIDGTKVAKVGIVERSGSATVADELLFLAWVRDSMPSEIVETVRTSYQKALLEQAVRHPDGESAVDPRTGEVIAGVRFGTGTRYASLRFDAGGRDTIADSLVRDGLPPAIFNTTTALPHGAP